MRFKKALLRAGTYHSPDGTVKVTPDRLRHWEAQFQRMRDARQIVPIDWDHASDASALQPLSLSDYERRRSAKNTVGHLSEFSVSPDGQSAEIVLDVLDEQAIAAAEKNIVQVSPVLFPKWRDGAGNEYPDCITHVDFVNHPVDHSQTPFEPAETTNPQVIQCALRMGLDMKIYELGAADMAKETPQRMGSDEPADGFFTKNGKVIPITVGGEDYLDDDHKPAGPSKKFRSKAARAKRKSRRRMSLIRMASDENSDDDKKKKPDVPDEKPNDSSDNTPPTDPVDDTSGLDEYDDIDNLLDLLEEFNIVLPDDTDDENLLDRLRTALHTAVAHKNGTADSQDPTAGPGGETIEDPMVATMSLETRAVIAHAEKQHRERVAQRLESLFKSGRCKPTEYDARKESIKAVKLSLDAKTGEPSQSELEQWIESREAIPRGTFWSDEQRIRMNRETVEEPPEAMRMDLTSDETQDLVNWALGRNKAAKKA